jgi:hypothetical protein
MGSEGEISFNIFQGPRTHDHKMPVATVKHRPLLQCMFVVVSVEHT